MLFFDDLIDNIMQAQKQGTTSVHVKRNGVTWEAMIIGIEGWRARPLATAPVSSPVYMPDQEQAQATIVETIPDSDTIEEETEAETEAETIM
jgi:hypothetical protein